MSWNAVLVLQATQAQTEIEEKDDIDHIDERKQQHDKDRRTEELARLESEIRQRRERATALKGNDGNGAAESLARRSAIPGRQGSSGPGRQSGQGPAA